MRAAQHFDALNIGKIGDLGRRTAAIDTIDEHANRRFDAGIIRAIAEATDEEVGIGRALPFSHAQRRDDGGEVFKVADLRALDRFCGGHGNGHRHFLQRLFALGCGNDDFVAIAFICGGLVCRGLSFPGILRQGSGGNREDQGGGTGIKCCARTGDETMGGGFHE